MAWVRRAGILFTVLVVALGLGGAAAGAKKKHKKKGTAWDSQVTLGHPSINQFTGAVGSKLETCRSSRVVTLFYTDPNNGLASPLSVQRTDDKADYKVVLPNDAFAGTYRVQVAQQTIRAHKAPQTCKAAESPAIEVQ
jgi:hypothetical protein